MTNKRERATLAGGCFWCTEALFLRLRGVDSVVPGYSGGSTENPTYEAVCSGKTGHAEAIQIQFNPEEISFQVLLDVFFHTHDPTTLNRQGADVGTQYRSSVFYHSEEQKRIAENVIRELDAEKKFRSPVVTEVVPFTTFYVAEDYHKNYYAKNSYQGYCQVVIDAKIHKLLETYRDRVKDEYKNS